jgi:predicted aconitase
MSLTLTDAEKAMLDGKAGKARQKAMELLVRYAEALGAERFVDTTNVAGVPGSANPFLQQYYLSGEESGQSEHDVIFSRFDLDSDELVDVPQAAVRTCCLQGGADPEHWEALGTPPRVFRLHQEREAFAANHGVTILKTCTPYLAGNVPVKGEHCAWMESSAVVYGNSVLGARTNTEGRESTSAAMLTGKIPDWGLHQAANRCGTHQVIVELSVESVMDWGMLGYFVGDVVQERIPVIVGARGGRLGPVDLIRHKHFGAAAASSGGVEMYHMVGVTPEADTLAAAFGTTRPFETFSYGLAERRRIYEQLNATGRDPKVDYVMLGCPHYSLDQIEETSRLLDGRRISADCRLWIFTSRGVRAEADAYGYSKVIADAGGLLMTDTCSAFAQAVPPGTRVVALDSAKQAHYLPAIVPVEVWFGSTRDCIDAAVTGRWRGRGPEM